MSTFPDKISDIQLLVDAYAFAADKHRSHKREDRHESPYINHLSELAHVLVTEAKIEDVTILAAAILHDTLEYTDTTVDELHTRFNSIITAIVEEVTDDKSLPETEQKRLRIMSTPTLSHAAKLVKLADLICNVGDVLDSPLPTWTNEECLEYIEWGKQLVDGLRGASPALEKRFDALYDRRKELR